MTDKHQIADDLTTLAYPIEKLKHLDGNPRKGNVEAVKKSYEKFGQRKPIVATKDGEVISGNHQLAAARELGWDKIAVVFTNDDELTAKAFALADNRTADLGTYDDDLLADMLGSVSSNLELLEATSFDEKDLMALVKKQEVIEDDAPAIRQTEIKLGQKYNLGNHTLVCGDATNKDHINYLIKDNVIDLLFTDPPYGIDVVQNNKIGKSNIAKTNNYKEIIGDTTTQAAKENFIICKEITKNQIIFGGNYFTEFLNPTKSWIVWDKENTGNWADVELAWSSYDKSAKLYKWLWNGLSRKGERKLENDKRIHPTQKPVGLNINIIRDYENGNNILDCFGGSGSTLIACEQLERNCFIMELDPEYCQVIIDRWEKFTGQKAEIIDSL
jgi:site-specific DNA-methyltransferase (adenine-specific)|tara:strand:- start:29 stop:1186 length:1158 start_codon:yes stop_codon:yes gene_type:complete